jgi:hypothetical protein
MQGLVVRETKAPVPDDPAAVAALRNLKERVQSGIQRYRGRHTDARRQRPPHSNDFSRLARRCARISPQEIWVITDARAAGYATSPSASSLAEVAPVAYLIWQVCPAVYGHVLTGSRASSALWRNAASPSTTLEVRSSQRLRCTRVSRRVIGTSIGGFIGGLVSMLHPCVTDARSLCAWCHVAETSILLALWPRVGAIPEAHHCSCSTLMKAMSSRALAAPSSSQPGCPIYGEYCQM